MNRNPQLLSGAVAPSPARAGDHLAIHQLLLQVFRGPSVLEFVAQQEEPGYSPKLRQVFREGSRILGHIRLVPSMMKHSAGTLLPVARLCDFAVQEDFRGRGLGTLLLAAAEKQAAEMGLAMLVARSDRAPFFERNQWFPLGHHLYSQAGPREILAELDRRWQQRRLTSSQLPRKPLPEVSVRRWKQTEHAALQRLYRDGIDGIPGPLARSDSHWRWLIGREAYDWLYLAVEGPDHTSFDPIQAHIVGYMFVKGNRIVEIVTATKREDAARALLTRACHDAMEQDTIPLLRLDAPADHSFHSLFSAAGGQFVRRECEANQWRLAKVIDWQRLAAATLPASFHESLVMEILLPDSSPRWLIVEEGNVRYESDRSPAAARASIACSAITVAQLLLGHCSLAEATANNAIQFHHRSAAAALEKWLPAHPLWQPPLEELPAG